MDTSTPVAVRPDMDIQHDLEAVFIHYPPLQQDRRHVAIRVQSGVVTLTGHVRTPITRRYLVEHAASVADVVSVEASALHTEEEIRLAAGGLVPDGVMINMRYGTLILNGSLPPGKSVDEVVAKVAQIPGVDKVVTSFN